MKDRQPTRPGRVKITPENGEAYYAVMEMADEPTEVGTPPTKVNLLQDATAALLDGDSSMVPDEAFSVLAQFYAHTWRRRNLTGRYVEAVGTSKKVTLAHGEKSSNTSTVKYSSSITISQTDGAISLKNPSTLTVNPLDASSASALAGKYFMIISGWSISNLIVDKNKVFFCPAGSTPELDSVGSGEYTVKISGKGISSAYESTPSEWEYLYSADFEAYPKATTGDVEYQYLGRPLENSRAAAKIASGTYTGTGAHLNKTFALGFRPKLFYIATASKSSGNNNGDIVQGAAGSSGGSNGVVYWIDGVNVPIYSISGKNYQDKFTFTPTDTGVKVVGVASGTSGSDYFNFNYSGCTYAYLGIG